MEVGAFTVAGWAPAVGGEEEAGEAAECAVGFEDGGHGLSLLVLNSRKEIEGL